MNKKETEDCGIFSDGIINLFDRINKDLDKDGFCVEYVWRKKGELMIIIKKRGKNETKK